MAKVDSPIVQEIIHDDSKTINNADHEETKC